MNLVCFIWLIVLITGFNPQANDLRILKLLDNVPTETKDIALIDFSKNFIKNFDKFKYILPYENIQLDGDNVVIPTNQIEGKKNYESDSWFGYYTYLKGLLLNRYNVIRLILKREDKVKIFLIEHGVKDYLMIYSVESHIEMFELINWINKHQLKNWGQKNWCGKYHGNIIKFVEIGANPWVDCGLI